MDIEQLLADASRWCTSWLVTLFVRWGVSPENISLAGLLVVATGSVATFTTRYDTANCVILGVGCLADLLDGEVARRSCTASRRGSFIDSLVDRLTELLCFLSLGQIAERDGFHSIRLLADALFVASYLCSYVSIWVSPSAPKLAAGPIHRGGRLGLAIAATLILPVAPGLTYAGFAIALLASGLSLFLRTRQVLQAA